MRWSLIALQGNALQLGTWHALACTVTRALAGTWRGGHAMLGMVRRVLLTVTGCVPPLTCMHLHVV